MHFEVVLGSRFLYIAVPELLLPAMQQTKRWRLKTGLFMCCWGLTWAARHSDRELSFEKALMSYALGFNMFMTLGDTLTREAGDGLRPRGLYRDVLPGHVVLRSFRLLRPPPKGVVQAQRGGMARLLRAPR